MQQWSTRLDSSQLKTIQEEMIAAYSNLFDALKEFETEKDYISGIWKGEAAESFWATQRSVWQQGKECADNTEKLLLSLENAENVFRQCENKVERVIGEFCLWEM